MPIYIAPFVGTGKAKSDPFRPYGYEQPNWSIFDLRKDCSRTGKCLVNYHLPSNHWKLTKIAEHGSELEPWVKTLGFKDFHLGNWSWYKDPFREEYISEVVAQDFMKKKNLRARLIAAFGSALIISAIVGSGMATLNEAMLLVPPILALPATDTFAGTGTGLGANWTIQQNNMDRDNSGFARGHLNNNYNFCFWSADAFSNDHYSMWTTNNTSSGSLWSYLIARASSTGGSAKSYSIFTDGTVNGGFGHVGISKFSGTSETGLQDIAVTVANGTLIRINVSGTTIQYLKSGVQIGTNQTDSSYATGSAGVGSFSNGVGGGPWEGGNIAAGGGSTKFNKIGLLGVGQF